MCANCKHTGCWIYLSLLLLITIKLCKCHDICSVSGTTKFKIESITLKSPMVTEMIEHLNVRVDQHQLEEFLQSEGSGSNNTDCHSLMNFLKGLAKHSEDAETVAKRAFDVEPKVWIASIVAVLIISAAGLLGVAIVPLFKKRWYDDVIQYLVALAVGCLTGDAFLHLLPHAIAGGHAHDDAGGHGEDSSDEREAALKGLVALCGIYFFYIAEKIVTSVSDHRIELHAEEQETRSMSTESKSDDGIGTLNKSTGSVYAESNRRSSIRRSLRRPWIEDKRPVSRTASIYNDEILVTGIASKAMKTADLLSDISENAEDNTFNIVSKNTVRSTQRTGLQTAYLPKLTNLLDLPKSGLHGDTCVDCAREEGSQKDDVIIVPPKQHHGHSHKHCIMDWKNLPSSMASVAWMVIMGDGLHNFTDGMAIGVAFTSSISGGISTSIAVFCHELPHELGDFAVLLKTGMGIKEAMFFNVFSSILCVLGMIVGIGVGNIESASSWIFALTAGTFVYIALVDMLPELSSFRVREGQSRIVQIVIQNIGFFSGAGIMLVIALFEKEMQNMISF